MLSFSGSLKVFVAVEPCDMSKGFNGLYAVVTERLGEDPRQGALFLFSNRRHTRIKILCWDGTGLWVLTKRGKGTKIMGIADGHGLPLALRTESASPAEVKLVKVTLEERVVADVPERLIGDKAYDSDRLDEQLMQGIRHRVDRA